MKIDKIVERLVTDPRNLKMGDANLAARWHTTADKIHAARFRAREILRNNDTAEAANYIGELESKVASNFKEDARTGEATLSFNTPVRIKTKEDLIKLGMLDLEAFEIVSYEITTWEGYRKDKKTNLQWDDGKPHGFVNDSGKMITETLYRVNVKLRRRKLEFDAKMQHDLLLENVRSSIGGLRIKPIIPAKIRKTNGKALVVITTDEHVAAASLENDLYPAPYDKKVYTLRKIRIIEEIQKYVQVVDGEPFDDFINITLGDDLDGWSGGTTRSGEPGHSHNLPQNMDNGQAVETYIRVNNFYWDRIMDDVPARTYRKYDVVNSNHGGKGLDYIANLGVQIYLEARYPKVETNYVRKFLGHFSYGKHNLILTHGKDEEYRKRPLPLNLNSDTEVFIKQYLDHHNLSAGNCIVLKGDLHQWNWNTGKFFHYVNIPSLYGSSGWVQSNFGLTRPAFVIGILDSQTNDFELKPVFL